MEEARLSHAYIVSGAPEAAQARAMALVRALLCASPGPDGSACGRCAHCRKASRGVHPDLLVLSRQTDDKGKPRREIYVEQVRALAATSAVLPNEAERKVYLIREAETLNPAAQNALLKLLEEPPAFDAFVLVCADPSALLETVRSRCVLLRAGENGDAPAGPEAREMAERWLDLTAARARVSLLSFAGEHGEKSNAEMLEFARAARELLADALCSRVPDRRLERTELMRLAGLMERAEGYLRFNVGTKHVLGMLSAESVQGVE